MHGSGHRLAVALACLCCALPAAPALAVGQDIIVVLDNSGSMRRNDPQFLARGAVETLINSYDDETRLALMLFDTEPRLLVPLTPVTAAARGEMLASLRALDYRGQWTNIPSAVERAIYHFRREGDTAVPRSIVFMTDGKVDTGDAARDRDNERWLLDEVTLMAHDAGIRIFGIAFTAEADFRVIQTLAQRTGGDYLRAETPAELVTAFADLQAVLAAQAQAAAAPVAPAPQAVAQPAPAAAQPEPVSAAVEVPAAAETAAPAWWQRSEARYGGLGLLALLLVLLLLAVARRRAAGPARAAAPAGAAPPPAFLTDVGSVTTSARHALTTAVSVIGRQAAADADITSVVVERTTVSRRHATIRWREGQYWIEDHGTTNGTFVNDNPVTSPRPLRNGDRIRVDSFVFDFSVQAPAADSDRTMLAGAEAPDDDRTMVSTPSPVAAQVRAAPPPAPVADPAAARARLDHELDLLLGEEDQEDDHGEDATMIFSGRQK